MTILLPGMPNASDRIEMPDIAELLVSPAFQDIDADSFIKQASSCQREIFWRTPLKHDKKYVTVRVGVWLLQPRMRSHVLGEGNWHIDGSDNTGTDDEHIRPLQTVHILASRCSGLTEFSSVEMEVPTAGVETRNGFINRLRNSGIVNKLQPASIEAERFYTFDRHIHRIKEPQRMEFRFFLRVVERDVAPKNLGPLQTVLVRDLRRQMSIPNVIYDADTVAIHLPERARVLGCHSY